MDSWRSYISVFWFYIIYFIPGDPALNVPPFQTHFHVSHASETKTATLEANSARGVVSVKSPNQPKKKKGRLTVRLSPRQCLSVHSDHVLRPTWSHKRPSLRVLVHQVGELRLQALGTLQLPLGAPGPGHERAAIGHADLDEAVREVGVERVPLLAAGRLVREHDLDEEHVRERDADG